jgi:dipeptide/tripeptide permease
MFLCIPGVEFCENMTYFVISRNLVTFLTTVLHESKVDAARNVSAWVGACFLTPVVGAFLADTYWGRYWTIVVFLPVYITVSTNAAHKYGLHYQLPSADSEYVHFVRECSL